MIVAVPRSSTGTSSASPSVLFAVPWMTRTRFGSGALAAMSSRPIRARATGVIPEAEARLGKPVITSNQALAWHMLRLAGVPDGRLVAGALFRCALP